MVRGKKANTAMVADVEEGLGDMKEAENISVPKVKLNLEALVDSVKGRYGKNKGLAMDFVMGDGIKLPTDDSAYVLSKGVKFWEPLIGVKGIPYGRCVQVAGKADSGKSTTAMLFMKAAQDDGALVILWDSEKKFDVARFEMIGGDPSQMVVTRSKSITEGVKQVCWYIKAAKEQNPDIKIFIVWDSVGATLNSAQDDDDEDSYSKQPGVSAKEVSFAIMKLNKNIERFRNVKTGDETIALFCVNQVYANINSVGFKEKGGGQLEYLSSVIIQLTRKKDLMKTRNGYKVKYGIVTRARVKKNHLFSGQDSIAELDLVVSATGIDLEGNVKKIAETAGITGWDDKDED